MKRLAFATLALLVLPTMSWAQTRGPIQVESHGKCVLESFHRQAPAIKSCDFKSVKVPVAQIFSTCNQQVLLGANTPTMDARTFQTVMSEANRRSLVALTADLNKRLFACGYMGEIEVLEDGLRSTIAPFAANDESCGVLSSIIQLNSLKHTLADESGKEALREQNREVARVYQRSGCASRPNPGSSDQRTTPRSNTSI